HSRFLARASARYRRPPHENASRARAHRAAAQLELRHYSHPYAVRGPLRGRHVVPPPAHSGRGDEEQLRPYAPYVRRSWVRAVAQAMSRFQCHGVDGLIVRSAEMRNRLQEYGVRTPVTLIPAAVETQLFQRGDGDRFRAAHHVRPEQLMLLYVGRLDRSAPVEFVLQALQEVRREIPEALLVIDG